MNVSMEMPLSAGGNRKLFVIGRQFLLIKRKLGIEISVIQKSKGTISVGIVSSFNRKWKEIKSS